jgi:hypothetical protein
MVRYDAKGYTASRSWRTRPKLASHNHSSSITTQRQLQAFAFSSSLPKNQDLPFANDEREVSKVFDFSSTPPHELDAGCEVGKMPSPAKDGGPSEAYDFSSMAPKDDQLLTATEHNLKNEAKGGHSVVSQKKRQGKRKSRLPSQQERVPVIPERPLWAPPELWEKMEAERFYREQRVAQDEAYARALAQDREIERAIAVSIEETVSLGGNSHGLAGLDNENLPVKTPSDTTPLEVTDLYVEFAHILVPEEPGPKGLAQEGIEVVELVIKLPDAQRISRRFRANDHLYDVINWIKSRSLDSCKTETDAATAATYNNTPEPKFVLPNCAWELVSTYPAKTFDIAGM